MARVILLFLSFLLASCGATVGDPGPIPMEKGGGRYALASFTYTGTRIEESDPRVTFTGAWTPADQHLGWSGGSAKQTNAVGATVTVPFTGSSIRWIGSRGRLMGIATVSVDGGPPKDVDLFGRPTDEAHTTVITLSDLGEGPHTLTITVTGRKNPQADGNSIVVDAFDIHPGTTISHWQDTDPTLVYSAGWTKSDITKPFSGTGVSNLPELPVSAQETSTAGQNMMVPFHGVGIDWIGYRGPDAGIATAQVDDGPPVEIDLYAPAPIYQPVVFSSMELVDGEHTLKIVATGRHNPASTGTRVVVDAFDMITPGRRYEQDDPSITYVGNWTFDNTARVWTGGVTATSNPPGATATFHFTGTSVSWIGCSKGSAGGTANIYLDGTFIKQVRLSQNYPIEGYQMTIYRADNLPFGPHTLKVEVVNTDGSYIVVDAFDVR